MGEGWTRATPPFCMEVAKMKREKRKRKTSVAAIFFLLIFIGVFCFSGYKVGSQLLTEHVEDSAFQELISEVRRNQQSGAAASGTAGNQAAGNGAAGKDGAQSGGAQSGGAQGGGAWDLLEQGDGAQSGAKQGADVILPDLSNVPWLDLEREMLPEYAPLFERNHDFFGWIRIEDTKVDYPVMYTPEDPEYYLHRAFDGSYSFSGVPFMDGNCKVGCGNYIIYGHHMKNGTMFKEIVSYAKEDFREEHPLIYFDTLYERGVYEVFAAFYTQVYARSRTDVFRYYDYYDISEQEAFEEYVKFVKAASLFDSEIEVEYGDQLITLSTCEYHAKDGRFVVVARRLTEEEWLERMAVEE